MYSIELKQNLHANITENLLAFRGNQELCYKASIKLTQDLHANITENILAFRGNQELCQHLPGMEECITLMEVVWAAITTEKKKT